MTVDIKNSITFLEDYEGALLTFTEIANIISCTDNNTIGIYNDILLR
jgi:hypothetical protein